MHVFCANKRHLTLLGSGRNFLDQSQTVQEKFLSLDTISSATVCRVIYNLTSGKMKGRRKCWKIKMKKRKKVTHACDMVMTMGWNERKHEHLEPMCDVQGMSVTTAETETDFEDCNNYAHAHVFPKCFKSLHTLLGFVLCVVLILCFVSSMVFLLL